MQIILHRNQIMNPSNLLFSRRLFLNRGVQLLSVAGTLPLFLDHSVSCMAADFAANPAGEDPGHAAATPKTPDPATAIALDVEPPPALVGAKYIPLAFRPTDGGGGKRGAAMMAGAMSTDAVDKLNHAADGSPEAMA